MPDERDDRLQGDETQDERNRGGQPRRDESEQGRRADAPRTPQQDKGTQDRGVERGDGNYEDPEQEDATGQRSQERPETTPDEG